ncbi:unnamed protein product [Ceutorhynchus assimilis]|uniref:Uncharacterized protein n=1 Tax=Ceutorhynchus assimilis TaxID=467358 RepID=A0A9N9QN01_9CUCU|nr:unnamed protein product [Ceutorhynchus assimilis]
MALKNVKQYFREYCQASSIHGIRYMAEKRTYFERGWWLIVFSVCLYFCGYFITMVYQKWENSPVIVSFATRETPIHEIPFPAVTICPEIKSFKTKYNHSNMVVKLKNKERLTKQEYESTSYMNLLCDVNITEELFKYGNDSEFDYFNNYYYTDNRFYDFMFHVAPNLMNHFSLCKWMNRIQDCKDMFSLILTDEGLCATFNMMDQSKIYMNDVFLPEIPFPSKAPPTNVTWSMGRGYENDQNINTYPRRALFSGAKNSLTIMLYDFRVNADPTCKMQGFKVILHTPTRVPRPTQQYIRLPLREVVVAAVQPVMITTSETVEILKTRGGDNTKYNMLSPQDVKILSLLQEKYFCVDNVLDSNVVMENNSETENTFFATPSTSRNFQSCDESLKRPLSLKVNIGQLTDNDGDDRFTCDETSDETIEIVFEEE